MKKILLAILLLTMVVLSGCGSDTIDEEKDTPKDPTGTVDPVDNDDDDDPIDTTTGGGSLTVLSIGETLNETYNGDGIAYSLVIDSAGFYSIKSIGDLDLVGTLSTPEGQFVSFNDNISASNDNFEMIIYLDEGSYVVGVSATDEDVSFGLFSLLVESTTIEHALVIGMNSMIADSIFPGSTNTVEFTVDSDSDVQLYTISTVDTKGIIYDTNGDVVAEDDSGSSNFFIDVFLESGTYFLEISVNGDFNYADYELYYDVLGASIDYETIDLDTFIVDSMVMSGEASYFELTVTETVTVNIYSTGDYDLEGELYRNKGDFMPMSYNDDGGDNYNFLLSNVELDPGTYYIHVFALESSVNSYELHVDTVE